MKTKKKAVKKKSSRRVAVKKQTTPLFPSNFKVGQYVSVNLGIGGYIKKAKITSICFALGGAYYDLEVVIQNPYKIEATNAIAMTRELTTPLNKVSEWCICDLNFKN